AGGGGSSLAGVRGAGGTSAPGGVGVGRSHGGAGGGLARARPASVDAELLADPSDGAEWIERLSRHRVDLLVLAGYLKLVPPDVVSHYRNRIVNVHPALLPAFGGPGMYGHRVHEAVLTSGVREAGATVHLVDEVYDHGAVLAQARVPVLPGDTPETLAARVLVVEHRLLPAVVLAAAAAGRPVPLSETAESTS
ncbi:MAG: formyltransferase family protein, partial [Gemmatimonadales bacterium]